MTVAVKKSAQARVSPLAALKQQVVALDAAMLVAVSTTDVGSVHKLRTSTRRVEAQMRLLDLMMAGDKPIRLPEHAAQAKAVRRRLTKVRRAAGVVRDLDVQSTVIRMDAPLKSTVHKGSPGDLMRQQAKQLRKHLESEREREATKLQLILQAEEHKLAADLRALELVLEPAEAKTAPATALSARVERWFALRTGHLLRRSGAKGETAKESLRLAIEALDEDGLHAVRKAAKLCRYMAESAPAGSSAQGLAERFESMQEAGGRWHDWLLLQHLAQHFHGKDAELTHRYAKHRDAALADYHLRLSELLPTVAV